MPDTGTLVIFIASLTAGVLSWWVNRLYGQFDDLHEDHDSLKVRLSVAESRIDGIQATLEKIESRLETIYQLLTKE